LKLARFESENDPHLGLLIGEEVLDLGLRDPLDLIGEIKASGLSENDFMNERYDLPRLRRFTLHELDVGDAEKPHLLIPVLPPEIWACGVTYQRSRTARESEQTAAKGIYDRVYEAARPEIFFKGTPHRCVGPNEYVQIRGDSAWTVPEPELVVVLGSGREVLGFTAGNDMSARDIEGENPLYLPQAKIYDASCALGPILVTPPSIGTLEELGIKLSVRRDGSTVYEEETKTGLMKRTIPELVDYLVRNNPLPHGSACMTGTGVVPPDGFALRNDDIVEITVDNVGVLRNKVRQLQVN
jgi:2-dehydro-3-deoxy-D-arabinonate dehydratase